MGVGQIVAADAGPLYLSWAFLKIMWSFGMANLGTARRAAGVNVPDQNIYKVVDGAAAGVLMDDSHELYGRFNRAQRGVMNQLEGLPHQVGDFFLAGYVFP